jgi:uncharacterized protein
VRSSLHPLRINVGFLINQPVGTHRDMSFNIPETQLDEDLDFHHLTGTVRVSRATQGMLLQAHFETEIAMQCVRCLKDYDQILCTDFDELFCFPNYPPGESGLVLPDTANIDLEPLLREYFLLEIPSKPLCKPDCRGLCEICGVDLNQTVCAHQNPQAKEGKTEEASRWSVLRKLQLEK